MEINNQQQQQETTAAPALIEDQASVNLVEAASSAPASPSKSTTAKIHEVEAEESSTSSSTQATTSAAPVVEDDSKSTSGASDDGSVSQGSIDVSSSKSTHPDENQAESNLEKVLDDALDVLKEAKVEILSPATVTEKISPVSAPKPVIAKENQAEAQQRYIKGLMKQFAISHTAPRHFENELTHADREYFAEVSVKSQGGVLAFLSKVANAAASKFLGITNDTGLAGHFIGMATGEGNVKRITSIAKSLQLTQDDVVNEYNTLKAFQESAMTIAPSSMGRLAAPSMARFNEANALVKL